EPALARVLAVTRRRRTRSPAARRRRWSCPATTLSSWTSSVRKNVSPGWYGRIDERGGLDRGSDQAGVAVHDDLDRNPGQEGIHRRFVEKCVHEPALLQGRYYFRRD